MNIKILITILTFVAFSFARAETIICEGITNDVNATENINFKLEIKNEDKSTGLKNITTSYESTIKYFFSWGTSNTAIDIADKISVRPNKISFKGSSDDLRNLTFKYGIDGSLESALMNYDSKIVNQPVHCEVFGLLPQRPVCADGQGSTKLLNQAVKAVNDIDGIETAIECGANVNQADENGCTPLMFALEPSCGIENATPYRPSMNKTAAILDALTNNGAFVSVADIRGQTPLMKAAKFGISDVYNTFIALEVDFDVQDKLGNTALMYAAKYADEKIVQQILEGSPDRRLTNKNGKTAYDIAKQFQRDSIVDLVRIADTKITIQGQPDGTCTPLRIELIQGQVIDLTLTSLNSMFKFESKTLGLELMADRNSSVKRTFLAETKGEFKFTCGFHGANQPSEGIISVR